METAFHYDLADKQLCFRIQDRVTTKPDIQLKCKAFFNTVTGGLQYRGTLHKFFSGGVASKDEGSTPMRLGAWLGGWVAGWLASTDEAGCVGGLMAFKLPR